MKAPEGLSALAGGLSACGCGAIDAVEPQLHRCACSHVHTQTQCTGRHVSISMPFSMRASGLYVHLDEGVHLRMSELCSESVHHVDVNHCHGGVVDEALRRRRLLSKRYASCAMRVGRRRRSSRRSMPSSRPTRTITKHSAMHGDAASRIRHSSPWMMGAPSS